MKTSDTVALLMNYFACTYPRRVHGRRDFDSQVMANVFDAQDRATLGTALDELVANGILAPGPSGDFTLTDAGLALARQRRQERALRNGKPLHECGA